MILKRIVKHKLRYLSMTIVIGVVFYAVSALFAMFNSFWKELNPSYAFDIEQVYEIKLLRSNRSLLGMEKSAPTPIVFKESIIAKLNEIKGVEAASLCSGFTPLSEVWDYSKLNDSIENFAFYSLGSGFENVLQLVSFQKRENASDYPKVYIESDLNEELLALGNKSDLIEIGKSKKQYQKAGIFEPVNLKDRDSKRVFVGVKIVEQASKIIFRMRAGVDEALLKQQITDLIKHDYDIQSTELNIYPMKLHGQENWNEYGNQIISMLIVGLILLVYVMLALLGLYWNETKNRMAEIGLMRAVGFTRRQVFVIYLKEATLVSLVAIAIVSLGLINLYGVHESVDEYLMNLLFQIAVVLSIVWISILIPALKAAQIQPVEALSEV